MNRTIVNLFLLFLISACSTTVPNDTSTWPSYGYEGYSEAINKKAGAESFNCGFFDLVREKYSNTALVKANDCVQYSIDNSYAFRFGTRYIPVDSYLYKSVLLTPDKHFWVVMFDVMLGDESETRLFVKRCESIEIFVEKGDIYFIENNCIDQPSLN